MREFFSGWKRKTGCLTLLMACVLAAGWVRSLTTEDSTLIFVAGRGAYFGSAAGRVSINVLDDEWEGVWTWPDWRTCSVADKPFDWEQDIFEAKETVHPCRHEPACRRKHQHANLALKRSKEFTHGAPVALAVGAR